MNPPLIVGIAGGTASGKTWLADHIARTLGPGRCAVIAHDRYYRDHPHLEQAERRGLDYDQPEALDSELLVHHLRALRAGCPVHLPVYDYATHRRVETTFLLEPSPAVIVEGLFVLADASLRRELDLKVFVHAPDELRRSRRIRRDTVERGHPLDEVLRRYDTHARPGHERHVEPSRHHGDFVWEQAEDASFPDGLAALIAARLSRGDFTAHNR
jgi:uridine kinase